MNIRVMNRYDIQEAEFDCPHIVISITDDVEFFPHIPEKNCQGILQIAVWDTEDGKNFRSIHNFCASDIPTDKIFSAHHAQEILEFVFKHLPEIELIVCQCDVGLSRSAATAAALSKILNDSDEEFFKSPYIPNRLIYETIINKYSHNRKGGSYQRPEIGDY